MDKDIQDAIELAWCRYVYHHPTSTRRQISAAWDCAVRIITERGTKPWHIPIAI